MTTAQTQTTQATQEQLEAQLKNVNASINELNTPPTPSKGFDWVAAGKTVGIFALGAAAGATGKLAYDHFFG